jgi:hypothetical protein
MESPPPASESCHSLIAHNPTRKNCPTTRLASIKTVRKNTIYFIFCYFLQFY